MQDALFRHVLNDGVDKGAARCRAAASDTDQPLGFFQNLVDILDHGIHVSEGKRVFARDQAEKRDTVRLFSVKAIDLSVFRVSLHPLHAEVLGRNHKGDAGCCDLPG